MDEDLERRKARLVEGYDAELARLVQVIRSLREKELGLATACAGWDVHDLVAHVTNSAVGLQAQVERMLRREPNPGKAALDERNRVGVEKRRGVPVAAMLQELEAAHADNVRLIRDLEAEHLAVEGALVSGESITVEERLRRAGGHYEEHGRQIAEAAGRTWPG